MCILAILSAILSIIGLFLRKKSRKGIWICNFMEKYGWKLKQDSKFYKEENSIEFGTLIKMKKRDIKKLIL